MPVEKEVAAQEFVQGIKNGAVWFVSISRPISFDISPCILGALRGGGGGREAVDFGLPAAEGQFALGSVHGDPPPHNPLPSGAHHRPDADLVGASVGSVERIDRGD